MDWNRLILDVLTALRAGEPVVIADYDDDDVRPTGAVEAPGPDFP